MQKEINQAKIIPLFQDTSPSVLEFLFKNLVEIEKDLDCILNSEELESEEKNEKQKLSFLRSIHKK